MMRLTFSLIIGCLALSGCSSLLSSDESDQPRLEGERISILDLQKDLSPSSTSQSITISTPPASLNTEWPQAGGYPHHAMQNLSVGTLNTPLERIWRADIGDGSSNKTPLNAKPVMAAGHVFTLDTNNKVKAFHNQTGQLKWVQDVQNPREDDQVIAGGLAYADGNLFVTSGYNEALALNPENGEILWRQTISAGSRAAPTILNRRVFINTMNNNLIALNAADGKLLWEYEGVGETTGLLGAASPAANEQIVIPAFSNGDIAALRVENGSTVWEDSLANSLRLGGMAGLSDIRGLPVIAGDRIIAASYGNRVAAFDINSGGRLWQKEISSAETPWVAGNTVYILTPEAKLLALNINDGKIIWVASLQQYENMESLKDPINWAGPIMINGNLMVSSSDGRVVELDSTNGQEVKKWDAGDDISITPIVAEGTLLILTDDGTLSAYR